MSRVPTHSRCAWQGHFIQGLACSIGLVLACSAAAAGAAPLKLPLLWKTNLNSLLESAATVADLRGDGRDEILAAGRQDMFAVDGTGKVLWHWRTKGRYMTYPAVLVRPGQPALIYAADGAGRFTCLDGTGHEVWHAQLNGPSSWSASVVCDLGHDGSRQVIQTDEKGTVWVFNALTGDPLWHRIIDGAPVSPAVGDLDGDGKPEIVVATGKGALVAFEGDGHILWRKIMLGTSPTWATSAPVIFTASDGHARIVAASSEGQLYCLDGRGHVLWQHALRGAAASSISVGDLDGDGLADIFVITQLGVIYRFDEDGRMLWDIDMQGRTLAPGAIVDIDGDGHLDYVVCTQDGHLLVLNQHGRFIHDYRFDNRTINATPAFGDLEPGPPGLDMVITGGESGRLFAFRTPAPKTAAAPWPCYRRDAQNTGSWSGLVQAKAVRMTPRHLAWDEVFTGEPIQFDIVNPKPGPKALKATAVCVRPDGARLVAMTNVVGDRGILRMPVDASVPGVYHFHWTLADASGKTLFSGGRALTLEPFANDRAIAARATKTLTDTAAGVEATLPSSASALRREAAGIESDAKAARPLQLAASGGDAASERAAQEKSAALVARSRRALAIARVVRQAAKLGAGTSVVAFEGTTWESRRVDDELPTQAVNPLVVTRRDVLDEHEPVSVKLFNVMDRAVLVRVVPDVPADGPTLVVHRSVGVPTSLGEISWDALPRLGEGRVITIPSFSTCEVWLDVRTGSKPGPHTLEVRFQALDGAGVLEGRNPHDAPPPETLVKIELNVLPFKMASSGSFRMCTWAAPKRRQMKDLLEHGNNVFTIPLPAVKYDAQGHLKPIDFSKLDAILKLFRGHDVFPLLTGMPALHGKPGDSGYTADLKTFLDELVPHMARMGFDTNHFAFYPIDEPGGGGWNEVNALVAFGRAVKAINPAVRFYADGGGELPMFKAMASCVDIWSPAIYQLAEHTPVMHIERTHGTLWSYNCGYSYARPIGANLKNMNIVADYRNAALFAMRFGATGIGFWCYNTGGDPWTRIADAYPLVYPGKNGPVTSRRWEAVREGIEDARILEALETRLKDPKSGLSDTTRARIKHLADVSLPRMIDRSYAVMKAGLGRDAIDATNNDATVAAFRHELMDCVQAVASSR